MTLRLIMVVALWVGLPAQDRSQQEAAKPDVPIAVLKGTVRTYLSGGTRALAAARRLNSWKNDPRVIDALLEAALVHARRDDAFSNVVGIGEAIERSANQSPLGLDRVLRPAREAFRDGYLGGTFHSEPRNSPRMRALRLLQQIVSGQSRGVQLRVLERLLTVSPERGPRYERIGRLARTLPIDVLDEVFAKRLARGQWGWARIARIHELPGFDRYLESPDATTRLSALEVLSRRGLALPPKRWFAVAKCFAVDSLAVRQAALEVLSSSPSRPRTAIRRSLSEKSPQVRAWTAAVFMRGRSKAYAKEFARRVLEDPAPRARQWALEVLMGHEYLRRDDVVRRSDAILAAVEDPDRRVRTLGIAALALVSDRRELSIQRLTQAVESWHWPDRYAALVALGHIQRVPDHIFGRVLFLESDRVKDVAERAKSTMLKLRRLK